MQSAEETDKQNDWRTDRQAQTIKRFQKERRKRRMSRFQPKIDKLSEWQTDRQADRQTDRQTDRNSRKGFKRKETNEKEVSFSTKDCFCLCLETNFAFVQSVCAFPPFCCLITLHSFVQSVYLHVCLSLLQASWSFFSADKQKFSPERCQFNLRVGVSASITKKGVIASAIISRQ